MAAKAETIKDEVVLNGEHEAKSVTLLKLILSTLPSDETESIVGRSLDLADLSQQAGMSDPELGRFLRDNRGLLVRTRQASKFHGSAKFEFAQGYERVEDVSEYIKSSLPRRVIPIIRPLKSQYRD